MNNKLAAKIVLTLARASSLKEPDVGTDGWKLVRYKQQQAAMDTVRKTMRLAVVSDTLQATREEMGRIAATEKQAAALDPT